MDNACPLQRWKGKEDPLTHNDSTLLFDPNLFLVWGLNAQPLQEGFYFEASPAEILIDVIYKLKSALSGGDWGHDNSRANLKIIPTWGKKIDLEIGPLAAFSWFCLEVDSAFGDFRSGYLDFQVGRLIRLDLAET